MTIGFVTNNSFDSLGSFFVQLSTDMIVGDGLHNCNASCENNLNTFSRTNFYYEQPQCLYDGIVPNTKCGVEIFSAYDYVQKNVVQNALAANYTPQQAIIIKNAYNAYMPNSFI